MEKKSAAVVGDVSALSPPCRFKVSQKESYLRLFYVLLDCDVTAGDEGQPRVRDLATET